MNGGSNLVLSVDSITPPVSGYDGGIVVTIPNGYNGTFVWGMTPSISGGFALNGSFPGAGGIATPVSLANGGLGVDASAFNGLVAIQGNGSAVPLIDFNTTLGAEVANARKLTITAKNGLNGSAYSLGNPMFLWLENLFGTFTISQGGGYAGAISFNNLASNRRALLRTDSNGVVEIDVTDALVETAHIGLGGGPAAAVPQNGVILGTSVDVAFA
jgi:hypothetical protein